MQHVVQNTAVLRARTILTQNGIRVNWRNVSYFTIEETDQYYLAGIKWKYKASIMTEEIHLNKELTLYKFFKPFGIVAFGKEHYVNLHNIITIEETEVHGPVEKTVVRIVFVDGHQLVKKMTTTDWVWWKTNYA